MNQKQYINALNKALKRIDPKSRKNIILEIKGLISELGTNESIEDRFGTPTDLANQYLQDESIRPTAGKLFMGLSKKLFLVIGILVTLIILGIALAAWYFSKDSFNYADTNAKELDKKGSNWHSVDWNSNIQIEANQGRAIIYWHDEAKLYWNCGEKYDLNPTPNKTIKIRHDQCLLFMPKQDLNLSANQADIVLIQPQSNTTIRLKQTKLRISNKGSGYQFKINATRSKVEDFKSDESAAIKLDIRAEESQIETYK